MCPCYFVLSVFYSIFLNVGKEGSLALRTREKSREIFKGVTLVLLVEEKPLLIKGTILLVKVQVNYNGHLFNIKCPTTSQLGNVDGALFYI